jgi:hypothetical protein
VQEEYDFEEDFDEIQSESSLEEIEESALEEKNEAQL